MDILNIVGFILAIISVFLSLWIAREPKPLYAMQLTKIGGLEHPDISILFKKSRVQNLYLLRLVFWNGGRKEIRKEDIPQAQARPNIQLSNNSKLLEKTAKTTTGDQSGNFIFKDNNLFINFDYLNPNDAFYGEIYLTTIDEKPLEINFLGNLKGLTISEGDIHNTSIFDTIFFSIIEIMFFFMSLVSGYMLYLAVLSKDTTRILISLLLFIVIVWLTYVNTRFNILSITKKIPKRYLSYLKTGKI